MKIKPYDGGADDTEDNEEAKFVFKQQERRNSVSEVGANSLRRRGLHCAISSSGQPRSEHRRRRFAISLCKYKTYRLERLRH